MGNKFDNIQGLELDEQEESKSPIPSTIEYGSLIVKFSGEEEPRHLNILSDDPEVKVLVMRFFLEVGGQLFKQIKQESEKHEN